MAKTRSLFISDVHLSSQERYNDKDYPPLFSTAKKHDKRLTGFIDKFILTDAGKRTIKDVILLGDIFDLWTCPTHAKPPMPNSPF